LTSSVPTRRHRTRADDPDWWRTAVVYQIYPRSFTDANGDGDGDLPGITSRLPYLADLGVDGIWISPFYTSPMVDNGYDVADPCDVDPRFGTLADYDELVRTAHELGLLVTIDLVPNHFSDQHAWFQSALRAGRGSAERDRFIFREGRGADGERPPNNWPSMFGGPAWTRVADGQWYLHLFASEQPDLNWENPAVRAEFARIMRFWLDRGTDGFRMDVAHGLAKAEGLPDMADLPTARQHPLDDVRFDRPRVHDYLREFRTVVDEYPGAMIVGEAWVDTPERLSRYVRPDELHLSFNFELVTAEWGAESFRKAIDTSRRALAGVGAPCTWVLSNHDVDRHATRYGGGALGQARARAAALIQLGLPGGAYVYNGDELGLENAPVPDSARQDPTFFRTGGAVAGRDGERVPLPWSGTAAPYGFTTGRPWLPMPADWAGLTVAAQTGDPASMLELYRTVLRLRHDEPDLRTEDFVWIDSPDGSLAFRRGSIVVAANLSDQPAPRPAGDVLIASAALADDQVLPPNSAVWLRAH
jgi:alpha-glucosidase